jgi:guanine nucleotide-binding protein G(i) subunit alpha
MDEALALFDSICNNKWFTLTSIILFLNKTDLFKEKIKRTPISEHFPDYEGEADDYESSSKFILNKFLKLNHCQIKTTLKPVYSHFTCATDPANMLFVIDAVNSIILRKRLLDVGLV